MNPIWICFVDFGHSIFQSLLQENKKVLFVKKSKENEWNKMPSMKGASLEERCVNNQIT